FTAVLTTHTPGEEFELVINAVPPLSPGTVQAQISVKTSSTNTPTVSVTAYATVVGPVTITPLQVTLPFSPITTKLTPSVTIQNNGTNLMTLSDPAVNAKEVEVQINELQPGRTFSAMLKFPEGFEVAQGRSEERRVGKGR